LPCASTATASPRGLRTRRIRTPPRSYKARGIVLRGRQLSEADRIVTLFTLERGKLDAVGKGVRRMRSHLAGRLELANECDFVMHRGRSLDVIVSAETLRAPWPSLVDPERFAVVSLVIETIDGFCEPDLPIPEVYELLAGAIAAVAGAAEPRELLPRFALRLLEMLGLAPPLDRCVRCGAGLPPGAVWLDAEAGGFIDERCRERWRDLTELKEADLENLRALALPKGSGPGVRLRATPPGARAVEELIAHHLGRRPKAVSYVESLRPLGGPRA
jgi:DNA repair protein RecO (recombination protein O)